MTHASDRFELEMRQHGLLRPLRAAELSDGTLRYLLWVAALLTPRPPGLLLEKRFGETRIADVEDMDLPAWHWPKR